MLHISFCIFTASIVFSGGFLCLFFLYSLKNLCHAAFISSNHFTGILSRLQMSWKKGNQVIHILSIYLAWAYWSILYSWSINALLFILHFVILFCSNLSWVSFLRDPSSTCHFIPILSLLQSIIAKFALASFRLSWENDRRKKRSWVLYLDFFLFIQLVQTTTFHLLNEHLFFTGMVGYLP